MKNWKRILGLALSAALLTTALGGCTKPTDQPGVSGTPTSTSPAPTGSATPEVGMDNVVTEDVVQKLVGIPADTTMFTVDGEAVTAEQFFYWLTLATENVGAQGFGSVDAIDWTAEQDGQTISEYILDNAKQAAQYYRVMENKADEAGVKLTDEESSEIQNGLASEVAQSGEEEYAKMLQSVCLSYAGFRNIIEQNYRTQTLQTGLADEAGAPTPAELAALADENQLLAAKHILIKTVDDNNQPLPEEEKAAAKEKADGILSQLRAVSGDEQLTLFDKLMEENSEDGRNADGTLATPQGYLFGAGQMVQAFEDGTRALEYGQISDLVESDYGYHIILRLSPDSGSPVMISGSQAVTLNDIWKNNKVNSTVDGWITNAKVEDSPEMAKVDVKSFFEKLTDYRNSLEPAPSESPAPTQSAAPTSSPEG